MPRFFVPEPVTDQVVFDGEDAHHIARSLRMKSGEELTLCDGKGFDYRCVIESVGERVVLRVLEQTPTHSEPDVQLHLYQALPKGTKLEWIIQKSVELGVASITPVLTSRCIVRSTYDAFEKKRQRYQKIANEAAKQSGRGILPQVKPLLTYRQAVEEVSTEELAILFYECGGSSVRELATPQTKKISFFVGSEGGFSLDEVELAKSKGVSLAGLGPRILRCETAPLCALSLFLYATQNI